MEIKINVYDEDQTLTLEDISDERTEEDIDAEDLKVLEQSDIASK